VHSSRAALRPVIVLVCIVMVTVACARGGDPAADGTPTSAPATSPPTTGRGSAPRRPNIVRILTDDQDMSSVPIMKKTQALLAARGVTYSNAVVSLSLCCPSRATLLTGQYAHNHHVWDNGGQTGGYAHFDDAGNSLAPWLHAAGYRTAHVGKYMNGYSKADVAQVPAGWDDWFNVVDEARESYPYFGYTISDNGVGHKYGDADTDYITDVFANRAIADLKKIDRTGQPFFLDYWPTAPHSGNGRVPSNHLGPVPPPSYENANPDVQAPRTANFLPADAANQIPTGLLHYAGVYRSAVGGAAAFPALIDASYRDYLNSLLSVDDSVERIVNELDAAGQLDNTVIIFMSDNGLMWGNHGLASMKWEPYEESLRVPLIITGPGFPAGVTTDRTVANIDIVPTMLQIAGVASGRTMDGSSLVPGASQDVDGTHDKDRGILIESNMYDPAQPMQFAGYNVPRFKGVRTAGFQYTEWADGTIELFDLRADPTEMHNLAPDPAHAGDRAKLAAGLEKLDSCAGRDCNVDIPGLTGR
jgi:N-acetylglucosamine-6-sulfatase